MYINTIIKCIGILPVILGHSLQWGMGINYNGFGDL